MRAIWPGYACLSPLVFSPLIITQAAEVEVRLPYQTEEAINQMLDHQTTVGFLFDSVLLSLLTCLKE
jgi:hypothetical protein